MPVLKAARRCVVLTGTPALNRPVELFTLLQCVCPSQKAWRTYTAFTERYCNARVQFFGRARRVDVSGSSNEAELFQILTASCMVRRLKADVLMQLPPKRRQRVLVELPAAARRALDVLERDSAKLRASEADGSGGAAFERQRLLSQMCVELGTAKAQPAAEYALELLPSCEKLLFFAVRPRPRSSSNPRATALGAQLRLKRPLTRRRALPVAPRDSTIR